MNYILVSKEFNLVTNLSRSDLKKKNVVYKFRDHQSWMLPPDIRLRGQRDGY